MTTKSNFVIEDIVGIDSMRLESELKTSTVGWSKSRRRIISKHAGGLCCICVGETMENIPAKKVSYDVGNSKFVEFYCTKCYEAHKGELENRMKNMNFT